ncbi:MAG: hypothetical protein IJZ23_11100 [Roseburia sp.]|nr:hypothetical protein [Roseburia sp.]
MPSQRQKMIVAIVVVFTVSVFVWYTEKTDSVLVEKGQLHRPEIGEGEYETELVLEIDGTEETELVIIVPERYLTKDEEKSYLNAAVEEIEAEFAGENVSLQEIRDSVVVRTGYQDGKVQAEWEFSNHRIIADDGAVIENVMEEDCEEVGAKVFLTCEDSSMIYEFYFTVLKREKSKQEIFYEELNQLISENGKEEGTELLRLPTNLEGHTLVWKNKESDLPIQVFLLGIVIVMLLPAVEKERQKEAKGRREEQLIREYPEMVNKLTLLLGAGLTLQNAWKQITSKYEETLRNRQRQKSIVYEEMLVTQREIESGKGEAKAYEAFGERCGVQKYRKLSNYLVQNLKKGNRTLCELLEHETEEAFTERKNLARQYGEEVGTKLLLPMLLMLGIVIFVIMVPAVISFQTGTN